LRGQGATDEEAEIYVDRLFSCFRCEAAKVAGVLEEAD
jgi:hypothetical protein